MKNRAIIILNRVFTLFFIGIFIWSLWPLQRAEQVLRVNQAYIDAELIEKCPEFVQLIDAQMELVHPVKIWKFDEDEIILTIHPGQDLALDTAGRDPAYSLTLDIRLDSSGLNVEPGERIVLAFSGEVSQMIQFNLTPYAEDTADGELWISVDVADSTGESLERVPLFVIPMEFKIVSVLGLSPVLARYLSLFVLLLQLVVAFRKRLFG